MGWAVIASRKALLRSRISDMQKKIMDISQELTDLTSYASAVSSGGIIDCGQLSNLPTTYHGAAIDYNERANSVATQDANNKMGFFANTYLQTTSMTPEMARAYFEAYHQEALKEYSKIETSRIHEEEEKLESEKTKLETQVQASEMEYKSLEQSLKQSISDGAIDLGNTR